MMRIVACRLLENAQFQTLEADDGDVALEMFERHMVDAVVLDVVMRRLGGADTCRELRRKRPDLPVVVISGKVEKDALSEFTDQSGLIFLRKPLEPKGLVSAVQRVMGTA